MSAFSPQPSAPRPVPPVEIALCITSLAVGGAEKALVELALRLDRSRFRPTVYALAPPPPPERSLVSALERAGVAFRCLGLTRVSDGPRAVRELAQAWYQQRVQLVQSFLFHANLVARLAAKRAGITRVVAGLRVAERGQYWHLWLDRLTSGLVQRYVCVSQAVADFSRTAGRLPPEKLLIIPNGVDVERCQSAPPADLACCGLPAGRRAVVFIGRLDRQKNVLWLIEHAGLWLERLEDHNLVLVGDGPERDRVQERLPALPWGKRVCLAGWRPDVPSIIKASDLLVLPSLWEGMPNVVLEAMACARPVVAADVEGVRELLDELAPQQTFPPGNASELAERIVHACTDKSWAARISAANAQRAAHFGLDAMVAAYERLYAELLGW